MTKPTAGNKPAKTTKKSAFSRITSAAKRAISPPTSPQDRSVSSGIAAVFVENAKLPVALGEAHSKSPSRAQSTIVDTPAKKELISISKAVQLRTDIFPKNEIKPAVRTLWPKFNDRINTTPQLVLCATLLPKESTPEAEDLDEATDPSDETIKQATIESAPREWVKALEDPIEQKRIVWIARGIVKKFANDATNDLDDVAEIALLGPILDREYYRELLTCAIRKFEDSDLLKESLLQGLVQLVQSAQPGYLEADDLTTILSILRRRLQGTHLQSTKYLYQLTLAVSSVLDIMAENKVRDLDRILEHEPLSAVLSGLGGTSDPYLLYQASYAFQALQYVPDNETTGQALLRHGTGVLDSMVKLSSVLKLDIGEFFEGLKGIHEVAGSIYEGAKTGYESICSLIESGQGVLESLKEGLGSGQKLRWYSAVRRGEAFVREGRLADFGRLVCEAPCRRDPFFQWGICQLLAEIATDSSWDVSTRQQAVEFLQVLFKDDAEWGQDESVRTWTLTLLERISTMPIDSFAPTRDTSRHDQAVKEHARTLLKDLKTDLVDSTFRAPYPLKSRLPLPRSSRLLKLVQDIPYVDYDLAMLKRQRLSENHQKLYIPPQAKAHLKASDDDTFPLMEYVEEFLASNCLVLLILGDSGSGKSTFNRHLEQTLWKKYRPDKESDPIPLYINLAAVNSSEHDMIGKQLARYYITDPNKVEELKEHREFILICDGYDELGSMQNLHALNKLNQGRGHWRAKMIITCRSAFLGDTNDYLRQFKPLTNDNYNNRYAAERLQEAVITPFTEDQVQDYIDQYVLAERPERPNWPAQRYKDVLRAMPSLMDLVKNPFLLTLALDAMPRLVGDERDLSQIKVNRLVLYDIVVEEWIEVAADRLAAGGLTNAERDAFDLLHSGGFRLNVMDHLKKLATEIFENQNGNPYVEYLERRHKETWKAKFFGRNPETTVLRLSSPLVRSGAMNSFIHLSVLDYFFARVVYDPEESTVDHPCLSKHAFAQGTIVSYPSILQFLAERVQQDPEDIFKKQLLEIIEDSKTDDKESHAAANAITILVKAGVRFNGVDLKGIRIPGADLTGGQFDSAQLQGADLTGATLTRAWIHQADFGNAWMAGVRFGEVPYLKSPFIMTACSYSPDGRSLAISQSNGHIYVYDSATWKKTHTLSGHTDSALTLAYSSSDQHIVSGGRDRTVRLWDLQSDKPRLTLDDYSDPVDAVAFSPPGRQFASASSTTIRIRDAKTGAEVFVFSGHSLTISDMAFSSDGLQLASSSEDRTIRLWNLETGMSGLVFGNDFGPVNCVAYSPAADGRLIASGHTGGSQICLWDAATGKLSRTLPGHTSGISCVTFTKDGQWIASSSSDGSVQVRSVRTGAQGFVFENHVGFVTSVAFSPIRPQIAFCDSEGTARLWDIGTTESSPESQGHSRTVSCVAYSSDGQCVFSGSSDKTVRQWNGLTGESHPIITGYPTPVCCMSYSPNSNQIATAGYHNVVLLSDARTGATIHEFSGQYELVSGLAFSPCGRWIASSSYDRTVRLWDTQLGVPGIILSGHTSGATNVAFSPSGSQVASGSEDGTIRIWDPRSDSGEPTLVLSGCDGFVNAVAFAPDGLEIASCNRDKTIRLWDSLTGSPRAVLAVQAEPMDISYSPCGRWLVTGALDGTARLWEKKPIESMPTWSCASVIQGFHGVVNSVAWSPSRDLAFVTGCEDYSVRVWRVVEGDNGVRVSLSWSSSSGQLGAWGANIKGVVGLSEVNQTLLLQRRAVDGSVVPVDNDSEVRTD